MVPTCMATRQPDGARCRNRAGFHLLVSADHHVTFVCRGHLHAAIRRVQPLDAHELGEACPVPRCNGGRWHFTTPQRIGFCYVADDPLHVFTAEEVLHA